nr:MFS transporter [Pseudomonadales bacterium]
LFALTALLILVALVPIGLFCDDQPMALEEKPISLRSLRKVSLLARAGMFVSGVVTGSIWAMTPLLIEASQLDMSSSGMIMMAVILGGATFQLPAGLAADRFGRLHVTKIVVLSCLAISMTGFFVRFNNIFELAVIMFLLGSTSLSLYTLASAEANDRSELSRVEIATALLLMNGVGSVVGPVLTGLIMSWIPLGLFLISGAAMTMLLVLSHIDSLMPVQAATVEYVEDELADVIPIEEYLEEAEGFRTVGLEQEELVG